MGLTREQAAESVRLTLGHVSTDADVDVALAAIPDAVASLRGTRAVA
jgi:cysteine sulfinate desulfinase/cysteine desulfurase-like protein